MKKTIKFSALILAYNQEEYINYCLGAIYPCFYKIVIMYPLKPFDVYNPKSRKIFKKLDSTLKIIKLFPDTDKKIVLKKGVWSNEEKMRNDGLNIIKKYKSDYCFIVDADEFYPDNMLPKLLDYIAKNLPAGRVAWVKTKTPFKKLNYMIETTRARLPVAFKIAPKTKFVESRQPNEKQFKIPNKFFYWHLGYVLPNRRMYEKVHTYGHAHQLPRGWFEKKWLNWTPNTKNLCRRDPGRWPKTIKYDPWDLPSILRTHPFFPYGPIDKT